MEDNKDFLWRQFIKLGDMMGDGLHHEPDGKWIVKEYNTLAKILIPKIKEDSAAQRKKKNQNIDQQIQAKADKCKCGGELKQTRSGSKVVKCVECGNKYQYKAKK